MLVVAEVRLYREGLASALDAEDGIDVVGAYAAPTEALARGVDPDVVLVDVAGDESLPILSSLQGALPHAHLVAMAIRDAEQDVMACAEAGAAGYVTREQSVGDVASIVRAVARGEMPCTPRMAGSMLRRIAVLAGEASPPPEGVPQLTPREAEVVDLIGRGLSNKQIARALCIELATVKNHVHNVLEKLGVTRRNDAVARVRAHRRASLPSGARRTLV